jgi:zinc protease
MIFVTRVKAIVVVFILCLVALPSLAQKKESKSATGSFPTIKYEKYRLPNGLEVILSEDHRLPLVAVNLWYHVGAANERIGRTGFAHLFEHMMFEGSKHVGPKAHFKYLEAAGANDINGTTEFDRTNYFETLPSNQLELALWLESDRMGFLLETLDQEKLTNQQDVVRNERRQSIENAPYGLVEEEIYHQLFPKGHPYYADVIGSHADIEAARLDDVRKFFTTYYSPSNASLAIVGDFDPAQVKLVVQKYFGSFRTGPPVPAVQAATPPILKEKRVTVTDQIELPRVYMAWLMPSIYKPGDADADLLAQVLGGGKSSRLYKKLVYEKQIAQDVLVQNQSALLGSVFMIQATAKPGVKPEVLEKAINEELEALRKNGPTAEELERARNKTQAQMIRRLELLGGFGGVADTLNRYNHYLKDPGYLPKDLERYDEVTPATAKALADERLKDSARVVVYGVPGQKEITDVPRSHAEAEKAPAPVAKNEGMDESWRTTPPKPGPLSKLTLPTPTSFKLPNGLTVMLVERHNLPIVTANLVTLSGSEMNPIDKPGLASFTAAMLQEGTKYRSALQIADDVDQIGALLNTYSTSDKSEVSIRTLTRTEDGAFNLLSDLVLNPAFDQKEVERVRSLRLTDILQEKDDPNTLARKASYMELYGPKHPYGYLESGTEEATKTITRDDLEKFWKKGYVPGNSALVVAGDITEPELKRLTNKYFGKWTGSFERPLPPRVTQNATRGILIVDKPGAPQTALRFATVTVPRSTPDYAPLEVMNTALGGLFSSRLNMNLREEHGYTYGAFSVVLYRRAPGPFIAVAGVRTDVTAPAVRETFNEIERIRRTVLTADELTMAKNAFSLSLAGRFETTGQTAQTVGELFVYDLPLNYYQLLPAKIDAVNATEVQRVAELYLRPEAMVVVAAGDKAKIEPELKKLNLAPISYRDYEGKAMKTAAAGTK